MANSEVDSSSAVHAGGLVADDPAGVEGDHAAAHLVHHLAVVGDDDDGGAGAVDPVEHLHDPDRGARVEVAGRLVGEQQRRMVDEGAGDREPLLLAAGELVGEVRDLVGEADEAERVGDLPADLRARGADHLEGVGDVVVDVPAREQLEVLEDGADPAAQVRDLRVGELGDVAAGDQDLALGRIQLADQKLDQGRLAAAGRPDQEDELASVDPEADPLERDVPAGVDLGGLPQLDDRRLGPALGEVLGAALPAGAGAQLWGCLTSRH